MDNYTIAAFRIKERELWFYQSSIKINYKINRFWIASLGYAYSKYSSGFHTFIGQVTRKDPIGNYFSVYNRFIFQHNIPKFRRYQQRFQYILRFRYQKNNLPARLRPFIQSALYYYLNGKERTYYDANFNKVGKFSPNGFHRLRLKAGTSITPIKNLHSFQLVLFYAFNKEFNLPFGNDLNFPRDNTGQKITLPFNNYHIWGIQINYFL